MGSYDPTSPKVDDGFIASDGEDDVQGHVYKQDDDVPTELRQDEDSIMARTDSGEDDVEGHLGAAVGSEFRAAATEQPDEGSDEDGFRAAF